MKTFLKVITVAASASFGLAATDHAVSAAPAISAERGDIKKGLKAFSDAADNTGRLALGNEYARIVAEHEDVLEAKQLLDASLPVDMKIKADAAVIKAVAASTTLKDVAADKDKGKTEVAQLAFAKAVEDLIALFPKDMQP